MSGWFILEPWVTPSLFAATGASNDGELQQVLGAVSYTHLDVYKRQHVEREIERAPVKLLIPTGTLILPALLLSIVGPLLAAADMV